MQRVVVLGGGVGGTLAANLIARKLRKPIAKGEVTVTVVDATGQHAYQPGYMYIAMGQERAKDLVRGEKSLLDHNVNLVVDEIVGIDTAAGTVDLASGERLRYEQLVVATGSRIVPEEMEHFDQEAHHFYSAEASLRLRKALDAFTGGRIVIGIAGIPYKCPPAPLEVAFLIESELRARGLRDETDDDLPVADQPCLHDRERLGHGDADPGGEGHPPRAARRHRADRRRSERWPSPTRSRSIPTICSSWCRRTGAPRSSSTPASRPGPAGCPRTATRSR